MLRSLLVQQATAKGNSAVPETPKESGNRAASTPEGNWARTKVTSDRTKTTYWKIGGRNDVKLSSQAFRVAVKMAEYIGGKKRRYFVSVRENLLTSIISAFPEAIKR